MQVVFEQSQTKINGMLGCSVKVHAYKWLGRTPGMHICLYWATSVDLCNDHSCWYSSEHPLGGGSDAVGTWWCLFTVKINLTLATT